MSMSARRAATGLAAAILTGAAALAAAAPAHADPGEPIPGHCLPGMPIFEEPASGYGVGECSGPAAADCTVDHNGETWVRLLEPVDGYVPAFAFEPLVGHGPLPPCQGDPAAPAQGL